jgi:hypothetical protein
MCFFRIQNLSSFDASWLLDAASDCAGDAYSPLGFLCPSDATHTICECTLIFLRGSMAFPQGTEALIML